MVTTGTLIIAIILAFLIGFIIAMAFNSYIYKRDKRRAQELSGNLVVEDTDPDGPYLFLELRTDVANILNKNRVIFEVKHNTISSQK